jgi:hypothetical protein
MKLKDCYFITFIVPLLILAGCGGGGDGDGGGSSSGSSEGTSTASYTYFSQGGLTWSSPTTTEYYSSGPNAQFSNSASYICSGAISTNGGPTTPDNFNKSAGWRLPTQEELQNLYNEMPKPSGWIIAKIWSDNTTGIDFLNGSFFVGNGHQAHVACVK